MGELQEQDSSKIQDTTVSISSLSSSSKAEFYAVILRICFKTCAELVQELVKGLVL